MRRIMLALAALLTALAVGQGARADSICARLTVDDIQPTACVPLP